MEIGIVGLPNTGKSTLFSLLTSLDVNIDKFPFTTINPNIGIVEVPDERLDFLAKIFSPEKKTFPTIKFIDIAGLIHGASQGAGLGNRFLATIREVDAIVNVVRYFYDETIPSAINKIDPLEEIKIITTELCLADIEILENYKKKLEGKAHSGDKLAKERLEIIHFLVNILNQSTPLTRLRDEIEKKISHQDKEFTSLVFNLLTYKPIFYLLNYDETVSGEELEKVKEEIRRYTCFPVLSLATKFELSLKSLSVEEQNEFRKEYNISEEELKNFLRESCKLLDIITFYTTVGTELRAWQIKNNSTVLDAAGKIHTDLKEGFINAEVYNFEDIKKFPSEQELRKHGLVRIEGREYIVKDGDIIKINFHT